MNEEQDARDLSRAIDAARRGGPLPPRRPRDLDALTHLLVGHAATLQAAVPPPVVRTPRQVPRFVPLGVAVAAVLLVCLALGGQFSPVAPLGGSPGEPLAQQPAAMPVAMVPAQMSMVMSVRTMPLPANQPVVALPTVPPTTANTPAIVAATGTYRVVGPGRADVPVRAAPDEAAPVVVVVFNGMVMHTVGPQLMGVAGDDWRPVQVGEVRGFIRAESLQEVPAS